MKAYRCDPGEPGLPPRILIECNPEEGAILAAIMMCGILWYKPDNPVCDFAENLYQELSYKAQVHDAVNWYERVKQVLFYKPKMERTITKLSEKMDNWAAKAVNNNA